MIAIEELVFQPTPSDKRFIDLTGRTFGRLTVLGFWGWHEKPKGKRDPKWICRCQCGEAKSVNGNNLKNGQTKSCGCLAAEASSIRNATHGEWKNDLYGMWSSIKDRTTNPNSHAFADYGGRGITLCERWRDFAAFLADMGDRPSGNHTIERKNNALGYSPDNCVWATRKEQSNNRRSNHVLAHKGESLTMAQWTERLGFSKNLIGSRLKAGWSVDAALSVEPQKITPYGDNDD